MSGFRFCPACGTSLADEDRDHGRRCPRCDRSWYRNMAPTAGAAIVHDGRALATIRARDPAKGKLDVPGGFLGPDEHPVDALKREVKEELDIEIDADVTDVVSMVPHAYGDGGDMVLALGFRARWVSGAPRAGDDVADFKWLTLEELDDAEFAWPHDRDLLRKGLEHG